MAARKKAPFGGHDSDRLAGYNRQSHKASGVMISSLNVRGYRGFAKYAMHNLTRINLLVGKNNSGKTSLLEALHLLWAGADIGALWQTLARRGEQPVPEQVPGRGIQQEVDVSHVFTGHRMTVGESEFSIGATNETPSRSIKYQITAPAPSENVALYNQLVTQDPTGATMGLKISIGKQALPSIPLSRRGGLRADIFSQAANTFRSISKTESNVEFIATESLTAPELAQLWNDLALRPEEELVLRALRFIDPEIERIAPLVTPHWFGSGRGGFIVRRAKEERVPIGSFGDGIWRIFSLAIALSIVKNGERNYKKNTESRNGLGSLVC
jgi:hypothetical protein